MRIGGLQKVSLIDYPGQIGAVVFTQGCNFRCPYCHNPDLADPSLYGAPQDPGEVLQFLDRRRGKLDAVTVTGGEPTLQEDLPAFLHELRQMGYLVKLDTNGSLPQVLKSLIEAGDMDFIAMDMKAPLERYASVTRSGVDLRLIRESIDIILASGIDHEFRTTILPVLHRPDDVRAIARQIEGAQSYVLQTFVPARTLDPAFMAEVPFSAAEMEALSIDLASRLSRVTIRS